MKLPEGHVLKRWMKWVGKTESLSKSQEKKRTFLSDIIQSQFNLITDAKVKNEIILYLGEIQEQTLAESVLRSYLYLMIGNITRSDNILRNILSTPPRVNWEKTTGKDAFYHKLSVDNFELIMSKLGRHPADRKVFQLFSLYLQSYYNDETILRVAAEADTSEVEGKIGLRFIKNLAPTFVKFLRIKDVSDQKKFKRLRSMKSYPLDEQSYWVWAFTDIDPLVSQAFMPELSRLEKEDQLWFIYLLGNEKLADQYSQNAGKSFLPGRRPFLKESLSYPNTFMMALYKLIELGDINPELVNRTMNHLAND